MKLIARIKGGLGNQLFCYAAARQLAINNQAELILDDVSGFIRDTEYKRKYQLGSFFLPVRTATPSERYEPFERIHRALKKMAQRGRPFERRSYIEEEIPGFDRRLLELKLTAATTVIDGLWQSAYYFSEIEETLRKDLQFKIPGDVRNLRALEWIKRHQAICIHVRWFGAQGSNSNVPITYYRNAIKFMAECIEAPHYAIFSDNPSAASKYLGLEPHKILNINWNTGSGAEIADLWLMSNCNHFIIANSTFSWWGSWLGAKDKKQLVLFPRSSRNTRPNWANSWDYQGQMLEHWVAIPVS